MANWWTDSSELATTLELTTVEATAEKRARLEDIAKGLQAAMEQEADRIFLSATFTDYFASGQYEYRLKQTPVTSITTFKVDHTRAWASTTLIDVSAYSLINNVLRINRQLAPMAFLRPCRGTSNDDSVQIVYVGGFATLPPTVKRVFIAELRREWQRRTVPDAKTLAVIGTNVTVSQEYGLMKETRRVLAMYRIPIW